MIFCADIHLQHNVPPARSDEPDWYEAMARPLRELSELVDGQPIPIVCAGDIFEIWKSPPELINFAIEHLPKMYSIPGQHDLPHHNLDDIKRSAYWTLVEAGVIAPLSSEIASPLIDDVFVKGVPWGEDIKSYQFGDEQKDDDSIKVVVAHSYISQVGKSYPGAPSESFVSARKESLKGWDLAVFGDNHIGFQAKSGFCQVVNCGCLIPRKSDERILKPSVWLLMVDGSVRRHCLSTEKDKWLEIEYSGEENVLVGMDEFVSELSADGDDSLDFRSAVHRYLEENEVKDGVCELILESMGE